MNKNKQVLKRQSRILRHGRVTKQIIGLTPKPRLNVFRSLSNIYTQIIDDESGKTLAAASSKDLKSKAKKTDQATEVGKLIAAAAKEKGITKVVFDRGGYRYHGRVKALAEAARSAGLEF
jgi:large subunit ribosomal protein L18